MKYQLVLQFAATSIDDFDRFVALEDSLTEALEDSAIVAAMISDQEHSIFLSTPMNQRQLFPGFRRSLAVKGISIGCELPIAILRVMITQFSGLPI